MLPIGFYLSVTEVDCGRCSPVFIEELPMPTDDSRISMDQGSQQNPRRAWPLIWHAVRMPALAFLLLLEPFVRLVLFGLGAVSLIAALFFKFFTGVPNFPFIGVLSFSIGCVLGLALYYALIRLLASK